MNEEGSVDGISLSHTSVSVTGSEKLESCIHQTIALLNPEPELQIVPNESPQSEIWYHPGLFPIPDYEEKDESPTGLPQIPDGNPIQIPSDLPKWRVLH